MKRRITLAAIVIIAGLLFLKKAHESLDGPSLTDEGRALGERDIRASRKAAPSQASKASDAPAKPALLHAQVTVTDMGERLPTERERLSPIYEYWAKDPADPATTSHEIANISDLLDDNDIFPTKVSVSCTAKVCRSHMTFSDMDAAVRLHKIRPRPDRRVYAGADPDSDGYRVSLYWTLTAEAKAESPDPKLPEGVPEGVDKIPAELLNVDAVEG